LQGRLKYGYVKLILAEKNKFAAMFPAQKIWQPDHVPLGTMRSGTIQVRHLGQYAGWWSRKQPGQQLYWFWRLMRGLPAEMPVIDQKHREIQVFREVSQAERLLLACL